jgi:hypothetical protein
MILEPKHKNFTGPLQIKETVFKRFDIRHHMSIPRAFECYYFKTILNWWHSSFNGKVSVVSFLQIFFLCGGEQTLESGLLWDDTMQKIKAIRAFTRMKQSANSRPTTMHQRGRRFDIQFGWVRDWLYYTLIGYMYIYFQGQMAAEYL